MRFQSTANRFWAKVEKTETCWLWTGARTGPGRDYGHFRVGRKADLTQRMIRAHVWAFESVNGAVPEGLELDHLCRNRRCVRPEHLEAVTHRENCLRGVSPTAVRARQLHCIHGHPFDLLNTYKTSQGYRRCRACHRIVVAAAKQQTKFGEVVVNPNQAHWGSQRK